MLDKASLEKRIAKARADRGVHQHRLNRFYDFCVPYRVQVGSKAKQAAPSSSKQDDLFDKEIQIAVNDFAADHADYFFPDYKPWVKTKAGTAVVPSRLERQFAGDLAKWEERLYDLIRATDFYEQVHEVLIDVAGAAGGMNIAYQPRNRPVRCQPILMANLLFDEGPFNDLDGRWQEFWVRKGDLANVFPGVPITDQKIKTMRDADYVSVIQGIVREWPEGKAPLWHWMLMIGEQFTIKPLLQDEPPPINVGRWRHAPPSAWGPGPADLALAAGQTLDELALLNLKKLGKEADPPFSYEVDGVFNPAAGVNAGDYVGRRQGSQPPAPLYEPTNSQNLYFDRETLKMTVKRALYQDSPFQRGDTPPTATQWMSEEAQKQRRARVRRRVYREFVLPTLQRFAWLFAVRGELEPLRLDGKDVGVEFVSPLSKASDAEEVSSGVQFLGSAIQIFGETALASVDAEKTMTNWKKKLGDTTVEIVPPDQQASLIQKILSAGRNLVNNG